MGGFFCQDRRIGKDRKGLGRIVNLGSLFKINGINKNISCIKTK